ncbi:hypothetical protein HJFPF1_05221 [Paramyrothecium foliicola]|nr:hypothetical protein HJFPF1_05221 [Paramyrothecium foliicola]
MFPHDRLNVVVAVRDALPELIQRPNKKDIRILEYFCDTLDTYDDVRSVSRNIWTSKRTSFLPEAQPDENEEHVRIDLILHLGMIALDWDPDQFRFETIAHRDGYKLPGDDGKYVDSDQLKNLGLPDTLTTSLDIEAAWRTVKQYHPDVHRVAEPLLTKEFAGKKGRVVFEHLPPAHDPEAIKLARDVTATYLTSLADDPVFNYGG